MLGCLHSKFLKIQGGLENSQLWWWKMEIFPPWKSVNQSVFSSAASLLGTPRPGSCPRLCKRPIFHSFSFSARVNGNWETKMCFIILGDQHQPGGSVPLPNPHSCFFLFWHQPHNVDGMIPILYRRPREVENFPTVTQQQGQGQHLGWGCLDPSSFSSCVRPREWGVGQGCFWITRIQGLTDSAWNRKRRRIKISLVLSAPVCAVMVLKFVFLGEAALCCFIKTKFKKVSSNSNTSFIENPSKCPQLWRRNCLSGSSGCPGGLRGGHQGSELPASYKILFLHLAFCLRIIIWLILYIRVFRSLFLSLCPPPFPRWPLIFQHCD